MNHERRWSVTNGLVAPRVLQTFDTLNGGVESPRGSRIDSARTVTRHASRR